MFEFYPEIRTVHIAAELASASLFALRGIGVFSGARWPMAAPVKLLSYTIDTVLLTAALMLMTIVQQYPFADAWLTVKVLLLIVYIVMGILAFRGPFSERTRIVIWAGALLVVGYIFFVARAHDPLGIFAQFVS